MGGKARKIVPKRIGGLKVPKRLRKALNRALSSPKTAEVASATLLAAVTALTKRGLDGRAADAPHRSDADPGPGRRAGGSSATGRRTSEDLGEIGQIVAGAASEAVRGVAGTVTRLFGEAVEGLRRDQERGPDGAARPPGTPPASTSRARAAPAEPREVRTGDGDEFGDHDDNDDPFDGNDQDKPGPMTGLGP